MIESSAVKTDKTVDTEGRCGECLWYGATSHNAGLGECKNDRSALYWNQGDGKNAVRISPEANPCRFFKSARIFLGEGGGTSRPVERRHHAWLRTHLYQFFYPMVLTGIFFYYFFRSSPGSELDDYTRTESERLSL